MISPKEALIRDTLIFLKETFSKDHQFFVSSTYPKVFTKKVTPKEELAPAPIQAPVVFQKTPRKSSEKPIAPVVPLETLIPPPSKERSSLPVQSCKTLLQRLFPQMIFQENPPADNLVGAVNSAPFQKALQAKTLFLIPTEDPFAESVQKAISIYLTPCTLLATSLCGGEDETLFLLKNMQAELVIIPSDLVRTKTFLPFLRELPASREYFLGTSPLLIIEPLRSYYSNPQQKKILWQTLCKTFSSRGTLPSS